MHIIASDCNLYLDLDRPRMPDSRVIHIIRKLILAVRQLTDPCPQSSLRIILKLMHTVHQQIAIAVKAFGQTFCTDAVRGNLRLKIAVALSRNAAVGHQETDDILIYLILFAYPDERNLKSFLENADRISGCGTGHFTAHVAVMGQVRNPANQLVTDKDRLCHGDVGKMGAAAVIWVVSHKHIPRPDILGRVLLVHFFDYAEKGAEVHRNVFRLGNHISLRVKYCCGNVPALLDIGGIGALNQRHAHLFRNRQKKVPYNFHGYCINLGFHYFAPPS